MGLVGILGPPSRRGTGVAIAPVFIPGVPQCQVAAVVPETGLSPFLSPRSDVSLKTGSAWTYPRRPKPGNATIRPAMDLMEDENGVTLHVELAGLSKEEVDLTLENGVLTIRGDKTLNRDKHNKKYHCMERTFGSFHRAVKMPTGVQLDKAEATFANGVLTIHVPKTEAVKARKLSIQ